MGMRVVTATVLIFASMAIPPTASATAKSGAKCPKAGASATVSGTKYLCTKTNKGLIWAGIKSPAKQAQKSSSPTEKLAQTISVPAVKSVDITAGSISGISASSKLPVVFKTSTPLVCSVHDSTFLVMQTGVCSIVANQPGNDKYLAAPSVALTMQVTAPTITSNNALFDEVQSFIRIPKGTTYSSDAAEISLSAVTSDATAKVCADDASSLGCTTLNGSGVADSASGTRYVEFVFHVKNLDANPLPTISYQLLFKGVLSDIDTRVGLETLNDLVVGSGESADGSFYGVVPKDQKLEGAYLVINEGITDPSIRLLFDLTR